MTLKIRGTRPTTAKVRSAVFNIWRELVVDASYLDVCAGTGGMGAEALRLGAGRVVGIELVPSACGLMQKNWLKLATPHQSWQVIRGDVVKCLPKLAGEKFDLAYFDPPYQSDLYLPVLALLGNLVHPESAIAVEHSYDRPIPSTIADLEAYDQRRYGDTALTFYRLSPKSDT